MNNYICKYLTKANKSKKVNKCKQTKGTVIIIQNTHHHYRSLMIYLTGNQIDTYKIFLHKFLVFLSMCVFCCRKGKDETRL